LKAVRALLASLLLTALAACSSVPGTRTQEQSGAGAEGGPVVLEQGRASWYGLAHHGRRTASGEKFDMNAMTAAHPTLPFGTRVLVRNPSNGRSVIVRINDRGPYSGGRIIDVSFAAARALGIVGFGTKNVVLMTAPAATDPTAAATR
jgi:rare lipoprotein A